MNQALFNPVLAQSTLDPKIWIYFLLLIILVAIGAIAIFTLRRKLFSQDEPDSMSTGGGLMEHLDQMRKSGAISEQEYQVTRRTIIDKAVEEMKKPTPLKSDHPSDLPPDIFDLEKDS